MKKSNKKGFTLIEMLVVIAIIAILVSIVVPVVMHSTDKAKAAADAANLRSVLGELSMYYLDGVAEGETVDLGYVTIKNQGGLISMQATREDVSGGGSATKLKCKSIPDAWLCVSAEKDHILVEFQDGPTDNGAVYYTIDDFARAAEGGKLEPTGDKPSKPGLDDVSGKH